MTQRFRSRVDVRPRTLTAEELDSTYVAHAHEDGAFALRDHVRFDLRQRWQVWLRCHDYAAKSMATSLVQPGWGVQSHPYHQAGLTATRRPDSSRSTTSPLSSNGASAASTNRLPISSGPG
jgi:hypothetical protein